VTRLSILALVVAFSSTSFAQDKKAAPEKFTLDLGGGVKMEFVKIKAGKFQMGADEAGRRPVHEVTLTKDFWMQTTETTQAQWKAVTGDDPSEEKNDTNPVDSVSWDDCTAFFKKANEKLKDQLKEQTIGFPTEAQWEYACRAGSTGLFCFGDDAKSIEEYIWHEGNAERKPHPVAEKKPSAWGLYDIHGNVWEWCSDAYKEEYSAKAATDPVGPKAGDGRILRGGSFDNYPGAAESSNRKGNREDYRHKSFGIRPIIR